MRTSRRLSPRGPPPVGPSPHLDGPGAGGAERRQRGGWAAGSGARSAGGTGTAEREGAGRGPGLLAVPSPPARPSRGTLASGPACCAVTGAASWSRTLRTLHWGSWVMRAVGGAGWSPFPQAQTHRSAGGDRGPGRPGKQAVEAQPEGGQPVLQLFQGSGPHSGSDWGKERMFLLHPHLSLLGLFSPQEPQQPPSLSSSFPGPPPPPVSAPVDLPPCPGSVQSTGPEQAPPLAKPAKATTHRTPHLPLLSRVATTSLTLQWWPSSKPQEGQVPACGLWLSRGTQGPCPHCPSGPPLPFPTSVPTPPCPSYSSRCRTRRHGPDRRHPQEAPGPPSTVRSSFLLQHLAQGHTPQRPSISGWTGTVVHRPCSLLSGHSATKTPACLEVQGRGVGPVWGCPVSHAGLRHHMFRARVAAPLGQQPGARGSPPELCKEPAPGEGGNAGSRTQNPVMTPLKWSQGHILPTTAGPRVCSRSPHLRTCCPLCSCVPPTSFCCALYGAHPSFSHLPTPWGQPLSRQPSQITPLVGGASGPAVCPQFLDHLRGVASQSQQDTAQWECLGKWFLLLGFAQQCWTPSDTHRHLGPGV